MSLIGFHRVTVTLGGPRLLDEASFSIEPGERVGLLGRNGEGKSTLLRVACGSLRPNEGEVTYRQGLRIGHMPQEAPPDEPGTVRDIVQRGADPRLEEWERERQAIKALAPMGLDPHARYAELSGGQKRRTLLARALACEPDLLILDEPTNHLDIESIQWLENELARRAGALLFVTHDRAFLRRLATRIFDLDRGRLTAWDCAYDRYVERKQALLEDEERHNALFDKKLAQEETWLRKGVKARRTRNEGRVRALLALREERRARRERAGKAALNLQAAERSGMKVIEVEGLSYAWADRPIARDFSTLIQRGDKLGLVGPNGCGKTTLLNLLLGRLAPQSGRVEHGTRLEIAYYDQHRQQLDGERTVAQNLAGEADTVVVNGRRRHIIGYLEDFLFPPERSRTPVKALSGGERNRLLLARLFMQPSNLLVMDEPTNDLDLETLDLLEDLLVEYTGTLLLVSHDRDFLNNVVTGTLAFEGDGRIVEYVGGYDDWLRQRPAPPAAAPARPAEEREAPAERAAAPRKLSFKERQELEALPARIEALEQELEALHARLADPSSFRREPALIRTDNDRAAALPHELETAYQRWTELEARA